MKNLLLALSVLGLVSTVRAAAAPAASTASSAPAPAASGPYHFIKEIHIGGKPNTDYLTVDSDAHRLYVSHADSVAVVDLEKGELVGEVTGFTSVHGIALAPKLGLGYISDGKGNKVGIFDLKTLKVTKTVDTGSNPDWIMYEPSTNEVYVCNGNSKTITAFDAVSGNVTATIDIGGGRPETAAVDPKAGRLYDNLEDKFSMAVIDLKTHKMVATWPALKDKGGSGLAIDLEHHHLFLGCVDTLAMMDSTNGKVLSTLAAGDGIDSAAFDPGTGYAFVPSGTTGTITVAKVDGDKLVLVQTLATATGAKTMALDPVTHNIYVATVKYEAPAAASASATGARGRPARPNAVADSFRVLVYGLDAKK